MPIVNATRPRLDVQVSIFQSLYTAGNERWYTVLLVTDDPGPNAGQVTIYGNLAEAAADYPEASATYKWADQFFSQEPKPVNLWILPIPVETAGAVPGTTEWSSALNDYIGRYGVNYFYVACISGREAVTAEFADASDAYEVITLLRNYAGDPAWKVTGFGQTQVLWKARHEGSSGNYYTVAYVDPDVANAVLSIESEENDDGGYDITVNLATAGDKAITTTPADIVAAVVADPLLSFLVYCEGEGTGAVEAVAKTTFVQGGALPTKTTGAGDTRVIWEAILSGAVASKYTLAYVDPESNNHALEIEATENEAGDGYDVVVTLATGGTGAITTTPADIVEEVNTDVVLSNLFYCTGDGTDPVSELTESAFTAGTGGASTIASQTALMESLAVPNVMGWIHPSPHIYFGDAVVAGTACMMNPGSFTLKNRIVHGITVADYTETELSQIRAGNLNTFWRTPAGHLTTTDEWASDGLYIDIQMAIYVLAHWQRIAIWNLLAQPPAGFHKVPYDNDGFAMIYDALMQTLHKGARPEWNFIVSRNGEPAVALHCPRFEQTDVTDRLNRIYRPRWEATFKGAVHEVIVTGYLSVEFIPPTEDRLGAGIEFNYS